MSDVLGAGFPSRPTSGRRIARQAPMQVPMAPETRATQIPFQIGAPPVAQGGEALSRIGAAIAGLGQTLAADQRRAEATEWQNKKLDFDERFALQRIEMERNAPVTGEGFARQVEQQFNQQAAELYQAAPDWMKPEIEKDLRIMRSSAMLDAVETEHKLSDTYDTDTIARWSGNAAEIVATNPDRLKQKLAEGEAVIGRTRLPEAKKAEARLSMRSELLQRGALAKAAAIQSQAVTGTLPPPAPERVEPGTGRIAIPAQRAGGALGDIIAEAEGTSGPDGYNTVLGYGQYGRPPQPVTQMTLSELYNWGRRELGPNFRRATGRRMSTAAGRYQIVGTTMRSAADALGLDWTTTRFTPEVQDRMMRWIVDNQGLGAWEGLTNNAELMARAREAHRTGAPSTVIEVPEDLASQPGFAQYFNDSDLAELPAGIRVAAWNQQLGETRKRNDVAQKQYKADLEGYEQFLRDGGGEQPGYTSADIAARLDPEDAAEWERRIQRARSYGADRNAIMFASPEDIADIRTRRMAGMRPDATYKTDREDLERLDKVIADRDKALADDPVAYVAQDPQVNRRARALSEAPGDPQVADQYATASLALQERLGVPEGERRLLSNAQVDRIVRQFATQDGQTVADGMVALQNQWGRHWPRVYGELSKDLSGAALVIGTMNRPDQRGPAAMLAEAASIGRKEYEKLITSDDKNALEDRVFENLEPFRKTLSHAAGSGGRTYSTFADSVYLLALSHVARGDAPSAAATKAFDEILGRAYTFQGDYRVPIEYDAGLVGRGADAVLERLGETDTDIEGFELDLPASNLDEEMTRDAYRSALRQNGYWVTAPDESGLMLYESSPPASVVTANDQPVIIKWGDLLRIGQETRLRGETGSVFEPQGVAPSLP